MFFPFQAFFFFTLANTRLSSVCFLYLFKDAPTVKKKKKPNKTRTFPVLLQTLHCYRKKSIMHFKEKENNKNMNPESTEGSNHI